MPLSLSQFVANLTKSGLMSPGDVAAAQDRAPHDEKPRDGQDLARLLVHHGKLTKYQATAVYQGKTRGLVLGEYEILDKIGAGGMGQVFKARHRRMERLAAIKVLPEKSLDKPGSVERFRQEVKAAAKLTHPNVVMTYDASESDGVHYLVMEYVEGTDLSSLLKERGPLSLEQAVHCTLQTAKGLEYAHRQGIIHRDIKPGNLLVDREGTLKILDMGLARMAVASDMAEAGGERLTHSGAVMGTCDYMAPEQAENTRHADARSDVYSLGCTLYRLLTGKPIYEGETLMSVLLAHREAAVPSLCAARADVPPALDQAFAKMVAKKPGQRLQSMNEVITALEGCLVPAASGAALRYEEPSSDDVLTSFLAGVSGGSSVHKQAATEQRAETFAGSSHREETPDPMLPPSAPARLRLAPLGQAVASASPRFARKPRANRLQEKWVVRSLIGGGAICLLIAVLLVLNSGKEETPATNGDQDGQGEVKASDSDDSGNAGGGTEEEKQPESSDPSPTTTGDTPASAGNTPKPQQPQSFGLDFDGRASYVEVPSLKLEPGPGKPLTIEAFVNPRSDEPMTIVAQRGPPFVQLEINYQRFSFVVAGENGIQTCAATDNVEIGRRVHVAGVWDGEKPLLYVDGKLQPNSQPKAALPPDFPSGGLTIGWLGAEYAGEDWRFDGLIDEVRISSVERYKGGRVAIRGLKSDASTLAFYKFAESEGDSLVDSSARGHHGKIVGATWVRVDGLPFAPAAAKGDAIRPGDGWVDILALIDPALDEQIEGGQWRTVRGGVLRAPSQPFARVAVPVQGAAAYELWAEFQRESGQESPSLHLPVGGRSILLVVDGWGGKGLSGLQSVQGREEPDPARNEGFTHVPLSSRARSKVWIRVNLRGDQATIEARLTGGDRTDPLSVGMNWSGPIADLDLRDPQFALGDRAQFGLGAWESVVGFQRLDLRVLEGEARLTRPVPSSEPGPE